MTTNRQRNKQKNEFKRRSYKKGALGVVNRAAIFAERFEEQAKRVRSFRPLEIPVVADDHDIARAEAEGMVAR